MKPPLRTKSVGTKVSEAEFALLKHRIFVLNCATDLRLLRIVRIQRIVESVSYVFSIPPMGSNPTFSASKPHMEPTLAMRVFFC